MAYKIIQWASGNVGSQLIKALAERPGLKLRGLYVYGEDKVGLDAGVIAGIGELGVRATNDMERILAMDADCVVHAPLASAIYADDPEEDLEVICRLLASGKNVISSAGFMYPKVYGSRVVNKLERACRRGGSSFHGTGANPGWLGDLVPLTMTALSGTIDTITVQEISNFETYPSAHIVFDTMGFGLKPRQFKQKSARYAAWLTGLFEESIQMVADGIGLRLDSIETSFSHQLTRQPLEVAAGPVAAGSVAAQRWEWAGVRDGKKRIVHETVWRLHHSMSPAWPTGDHSITVAGTPNMYLEFGPRWNDDVRSTTSMHALNAIPYVCQASCGIQTFLDLPWIMGRAT